jgi:hypothetical protein
MGQLVQEHLELEEHLQAEERLLKVLVQLELEQEELV